MHPGDTIGRYVLVRLLGEGGMKQVWRARDGDGGRDIALALVHQFEAAAFRNEVALAIRVKSRHVARVIDGFVTDGGVAVVVSELCDGLDLMHYRQARDVSPGQAAAMIAQMATGLAAIHGAHVLHRDVKPANAILTAEGVKVIDFGVSLPAMDALTAPGGFAPPAGTLPYMAPEAMTGDVDARLDTYALGVSLYELVVGHMPLPRLGVREWMDRLARADHLPADKLHAVDRRVAGMFERLTQPDRARRPYIAEIERELYALARELGGEVPTVIGLPAVSSPPPSPRAPLRGTRVVDPPAAPTVYSNAPLAAVRARLLRLDVALDDPARVVIGWPHLPVLALWPDRHSTVVRTLVRGFDPDGQERMAVPVLDDLCGGLVADLDGDGVGELYAWSAGAVHVIDAAGVVRTRIDVRRRAGAEPWDTGAFAPIVLEPGIGERSRDLALGAAALDGATLSLRALAGGFEGKGEALADALGVSGMSCHGDSRQRFRGDIATPAAILARRRAPFFVVAALERVFDGSPTVKLGLWGPGGRRVGGGTVGSYDFSTAPWEMGKEAQRSSHALFGDHVAPLAVLGNGRPEDDVVVVPFLSNAPWFGPVLVAFDGTGTERWRDRVPALLGAIAAPPMLVDLAGTGAPQLIWGDSQGTIHRRVARTGEPLPELAKGLGLPIAAMDVGGRGQVHLVHWRRDAIELSVHGRCLPGAVQWLPTRGDLWRSGTLAADGLPIGPRA